MKTLRAPSIDTERDLYPSRLGRPPELLPRRHPVVYPGGEGPLDAVQVRRFDERGFLTVEDVFGTSEVEWFDEALHALMDSMTADDAHRVIREPQSDAVRSVFAFHADDGPLASVCGDDRLAGVARQLLASDVYVHQSRVNRKPSLRGRDFQWHSDFETWHTEDGMPAPRCLSASVALTDNHEFNGPLMVMPGSHHWFVSCVEPTPDANHETSLKRQEVGVPEEESLFEVYEHCGIEQCTGPAGSVTFFDSNLLHASSSNVSPLSRRNLFIVFNSVENALRDPYSAPQRRPEHIASRQIRPLAGAAVGS
ncbi:ectoine hydroxylase [Actinospongicola halichondriae]|uniref:ectoine hydroxylase n=1 Tax=Actinospongicola halichondriae TaxID=3236844 RepID=UPI003D3B7014